MIGLIVQDGERTVHLLEEHDPDDLVAEGHGRQRDPVRHSLHQLPVEAGRSADVEEEVFRRAVQNFSRKEANSSGCHVPAVRAQEHVHTLARLRSEFLRLNDLHGNIPGDSFAVIVHQIANRSAFGLPGQADDQLHP